jgi:branched-subunit amino acid ABC-type transport system permease component
VGADPAAIALVVPIGAADRTHRLAADRRRFRAAFADRFGGADLRPFGTGPFVLRAEGFPHQAADHEIFRFGTVIVTSQTLLMLASGRRVQLAAVFVLRAHASGKALRATSINRIGARIVGIRPASTGTLAFLLASLLGAISGILIGPVTTLYYDSGFIIGLKAFVGAIIGGLVSYPGTAIGARSRRPARELRFVLEQLAQGGGGLQLLIPVMLWRSLSLTQVDEEDAEVDG